MSDRLKNTIGINNEEIIDDLTKDLEESLSTTDKAPENTKDPIDPPESSGNASSATADSQKPTDSNIPNDGDYFKEDPQPDTIEPEDESDNEVDEEVLKEAEVDLTDDQKSERKIIAEELKKAGNDAYKGGEFERSIEKYTEGLRICPLQFAKQRAILYCNRSAARMKLEKYDKAIKDCTKAIELDDTYVKAYIRRAQSYEAKERLEECLEDYKKILTFDPSHAESRRAVTRLPAMIEEKNEKLKTEMFGKLKDLGNMILKPFGLSTENFKLEQDPESKGYKINFQQ